MRNILIFFAVIQIMIVGAWAFQDSDLLGAVSPIQVSQGGTGSTTLSGILAGNGTNAVKTVVVGTGLTWDGSTLSNSVTDTNYLTNSGSNTYLNTGSNLQAPRFEATSTTASIFPYASSTSVSATRFWGALTGDVTGTASLATALAANGANCSAGSAAGGVSASGVAEDCTDYWTEAENTSAAYIDASALTPYLTLAAFYSTTTADIAEGGTNYYYTDARVNSYIHSSTTIPKTYTANTFTALQTATNATTTYLTVTDLFTGTIKSGTWNGSTIGIAYGGTNATSYNSHQLLSFNGTAIVSTSTPTAARYIATSTTASSFPYASSTGYTVTDIWIGTVKSGTWNGSTIGVAYGGTNATTFGSHMLLGFNGTSVVATSTPVVGSVYASSTTATSTFLGGVIMSGRVQTKTYPSFVYASSTAFIGTTTVALGPAFDNQTFNSVKCFTDAGTTDVYFTDGTNRMNWLQASTTVGTIPLSTNNTFTPGEKRYIEIGNPQTSPKSLSCSFDITINN